MADDNRLRSYRANDAYRHDQPEAADSLQGADPLAELARLIGQSDPFTQGGREAPRNAEARAIPADDWRRHIERPAYESMREPAEPAGHDPYRMAAPEDHAADYADPHGGYRNEPQYAAGYGDHDQPAHHDRSHDPHELRAGYDDRGYADDQGYDNHPPHDADVYDDPPRAIRRGSRLITAVLLIGCAMLGTAGAYGYRSYMTGPGQGQAPVIVADRSPNKVVPAATDPAPTRSQERFTGSTGNENLVSREEQPVALPPANNGAPPRVVLPAPVQPQSGSAAAPSARSSETAEPKRVRTVVIRPNGEDPAVQPMAAAPPARTVNPPSARSARAVPPPPQSGPLSLDPNAPASANARATQQQRPLTPPAPRDEAAPRLASAPSNGHSGGYAVQVSSQRSESDARASFRSLQAKYPQLRNHQSFVRRADLGSRGTYYRTMVGPFGSAGEAKTFCDGLKASGGQCVIQRN